MFKTLISIVIFSVALILSDHFARYVTNRPNYGIYIRLGSLSIIFQSIFDTAGAIFIGFDHTGYRAIATTIQALAKSLLSPLFILLGLGVTGVLTGYVLSYIIAALVSTCLLLIIAILLSNSASTILGAYIAKTRFQVQPEYPNIALIYLVAFTSALPALLTVHFIPLPTLPKLLLSGVTYMFMYFTLIPIARIIDKPELESIMQHINNMRGLNSVTKPFFIYLHKLITKIER